MDLTIEDGVLKRIRDPEERIVVPEGVESIVQGAFGYRSGIRKVILPSSLRRIEDWGFSGCRDLEEIIVPDGVTYVGFCAFMGCNSLRRALLPQGLEALMNDTFSYCRSLSEVVLPASLKTIGRGCFCHAESLCEISLPEGLEEIGYQAFMSTALREITIPKSLRRMGRGAFSNDPGIRINLWDSIGYVPNDMCIIFATGVETVERFTEHSVTVSEETGGKMILCVPMFPDESDAWMKALNRVWGELSRFDMGKVDSAFSLIRSFETRSKVAVFRLRNDISLSERARDTYLEFIRVNELKIVEEAIMRDDADLVDFLDSVGAVSGSNLDLYLSLAGKHASTECCALLMEKSRGVSREEDSLSLEGLW